MSWTTLDAKGLRQARYDAERRQLLVRMAKGRVRRHDGILPHMYDNLLIAEDKDFYYRYHIEPSRVVEKRRPVFPNWLKLAVLALLLVLFPALGLALGGAPLW